MINHYLDYLSNEKYSEHTIETHKKTLSMFHAFLKSKYTGPYEYYSITSSDIKEFLTYKREKDSNSNQTLNKHLRILKKYFDFLWLTNQIAVDPAVKLKYIQEIEKSSYKLVYPELVNLTPKILNSHSLKTVAKAIYVLALKGLRTSEYYFKKEDVTDLGDIVVIEIKRPNAVREIVLKEREAEVFMTHFNDSLFTPSEYVFTSKKHGTQEYEPMGQDSIYTQLQTIRERFDLPKPFKLMDIRYAYTHYLRTEKQYSIDQLAEELAILKTSAVDLAKEAIERYEAQ